MTKFNIGLIRYPGCMTSAVFGMEEVFTLANSLCVAADMDIQFAITHLDFEIDPTISTTTRFQIIIIPPNISGLYYLNPAQNLTTLITQQHQGGCIICSTCAGAFILAATGLLDHRQATTHWQLSEDFSTRYPNTQIDTNKILINDRDLITAGGLMSWLDLGMELIAQFTSPLIMRQLGKLMVVDTGPREQRFYKSFTPHLAHGNTEILKTQHHMQSHYEQVITLRSLASISGLGERTFLRHFVTATGHKPIEYLQKLRIQQACISLETTSKNIDTIAHEVGYQDISGFRKVFIRIMGLTPKAFKARFGKG